MNSTLSPWNELPARLLRSVGVYRHGIASLRQVDDQALRQYTDWLSRGMHAGMDYLERYPDIRRDPRMLLDGATTVISCAFPYFTPISRTHGTANIALYALGTDYHEVVRNRLEQAAEAIRDTFGGQTRVCVDTAPLRERYWALHSGLGFIGTNNHLIIPGAGSYFFLGEILTTAPSAATRHRLRTVRTVRARMSHRSHHPGRLGRCPQMSLLPHHRAPGRFPRGHRPAWMPLRMRPLRSGVPAQCPPAAHRHPRTHAPTRTARPHTLRHPCHGCRSIRPHIPALSHKAGKTIRHATQRQSHPPPQRIAPVITNHIRRIHRYLSPDTGQRHSAFRYFMA